MRRAPPLLDAHRVWLAASATPAHGALPTSHGAATRWLLRDVSLAVWPGELVCVAAADRAALRAFAACLRSDATPERGHVRRASARAVRTSIAAAVTPSRVRGVASRRTVRSGALTDGRPASYRASSSRADPLLIAEIGVERRRGEDRAAGRSLTLDGFACRIADRGGAAVALIAMPPHERGPVASGPDASTLDEPTLDASTSGPPDLRETRGLAAALARVARRCPTRLLLLVDGLLVPPFR